MKNVLFATTALVAMSGSAFAAGHAAGPVVTFSGEINTGYNDDDKGGLFWDAELELGASIDLGDNVTASLDVTLLEWSQNGNGVTSAATVEVAYTGDTLSASLKMGDMDDKGASEYFYTDRDGMAIDVENHDGDDEVRAIVEFGSFGVAAGCDMDGSGTCDATTGYNFGAGATFGSIELGFGYDEADADLNPDEKWGVSADTTFGAASVGVSYISNETTGLDSVGVAVGYTVSDALSVGAYFATNSGLPADSYGVNVDYTAGAMTVDVFFDHTTAGTDEYGVDVSYALNDQLTVNAGYLSGAADSIINGADFIDDHFYAGVEYVVNDNISATVSYSSADEDLGDPEYFEGVSAFITATF